MRFRLRNLAYCVALTVLAIGCASWLHAAEQSSASKAKEDPQSIDLFAGIDSGDLQVKFIPKSDREASLLIENKTNQPVSVKLPDAFVGVPVLAQNAVGNGNNNGNRNRNNNNNNNQNQNLGGGGGGQLGGGGIFNLPPEKSGTIKLPVVCLDHGKKDPTSTMPYEIRPVESFTKDAQLIQLLTMLGSGQLDQRAAQAVAWHLANGMSWQELAAKRIHHLGGRPDEPYFTAVQLQLALRIASQAEQLAKDHPVPKTDDSYSASSDSTSKDSANSTSFTVGASAHGK